MLINGKTSRLYTSNIFLQHKAASNQSRNKPINPPPTYHPVVIIFLSRISHQQLISITIIPQNCLHNDLLYFLLWHCCTSFFDTSFFAITSSKTKKNNTSPISSNVIIPKKDLKELCSDLLKQWKEPELSTKKPQLR